MSDSSHVGCPKHQIWDLVIQVETNQNFKPWLQTFFFYGNQQQMLISTREHHIMVQQQNLVEMALT